MKALRDFIAPPDHIRQRIELWTDVMDGKREPPMRSKPIVVDGPSQTGKSQWAAHWFGADATLTVNCQDCAEPPLKYYADHQGEFKAIIFEEANWKLVYNNKLLFQATNNSIDLGRSATNCHHYRLRCCCVPMFVLGNEFSMASSRTPPPTIMSARTSSSGPSLALFFNERGLPVCRVNAHGSGSWWRVALVSY